MRETEKMNCINKYETDENPSAEERGLKRGEFLKKAAITAGAAGLLSNSPVVASSVHSDLRDPKLLKRFKHISNCITCTCGKSMPILYVNDPGTCYTWPMRTIIDGLLKDGYSDDFIIDGFIEGFGDLADNHEAFELARSRQYSSMMPGLRKGYGKALLTEPPDSSPAAYVGVAGVGIAAVAMTFLKMRHKNLSEENQKTEELSEKEERLMQNLYDDEEK